MNSRDGLPLGALPSGILKIEKYCPGLKVRSPISRMLFVSAFLFAIMISSFLGSRVAPFWSLLVRMLKNILVDHTVCSKLKSDVPQMKFSILHQKLISTWVMSHNPHHSYLFLYLGYGNFGRVFILFDFRCIFYSYWGLFERIFHMNNVVLTDDHLAGRISRL